MGKKCMQRAQLFEIGNADFLPGPPKVGLFETMISGMLNWDVQLVCPFHSQDDVDHSNTLWYKEDQPLLNQTNSR
jgi:hypothetical protein